MLNKLGNNMKWLTNINEAKEESLHLRKPILLQFEMEGCGGCKKLYNKTYPDASVIKEMTEKFVLLKLDLIKDRVIRKELSAYWTPSFYFLDYKGKSYFNFNGYLPPEEFRIILRLGYAETLIPKGGYADAIEFMQKDIEQLGNRNPLMPKLLSQIGIADYIKTKDKNSFMKLMAHIY